MCRTCVVLPCSCSLPYAARCPCPASSPSPCLAHRPRADGRRKTDRARPPPAGTPYVYSSGLHSRFRLRYGVDVKLGCAGGGVRESRSRAGAERRWAGSAAATFGVGSCRGRYDSIDATQTRRRASQVPWRAAVPLDARAVGASIPPAVRGRNAGACHAWKRGYDRGTGPSPLKSCAWVPAALCKAGNIPSLSFLSVEARALISGSDFDGTNVEVHPLP